jgi:hypothetical protein
LILYLCVLSVLRVFFVCFFLFCRFSFFFFCFVIVFIFFFLIIPLFIFFFCGAGVAF